MGPAVINPMRTPAAVERFASDTCLADTGFRASTISYLWTKYNMWNGSGVGQFGGARALPEASPDQRAFHFYCVFVLIHKHPQRNWKSQFTSRSGEYKLSDRGRYKHVYPLAVALAEIMDEVCVCVS